MPQPGRSDPPQGARTRGHRENAEPEELAHMSFSKAHRAKLRSTNPIGHLSCEIKRWTEVTAIFPSNDTVIHLAGAMPQEREDE